MAQRDVETLYQPSRYNCWPTVTADTSLTMSWFDSFSHLRKSFSCVLLQSVNGHFKYSIYWALWSKCRCPCSFSDTSLRDWSSCHLCPFFSQSLKFESCIKLPVRHEARLDAHRSVVFVSLCGTIYFCCIYTVIHWSFSCSSSWVFDSRFQEERNVDWRCASTQCQAPGTRHKTPGHKKGLDQISPV